MKRRRSPLWWLLAAFVLLALGALVKRACGSTPEIAERPAPELPRAMRPSESQRMTQRQVLPTGLMSQRPERHRDPVLSALSAPDAGTALVFEANALRHSPVGQLLLDCLATSSMEGLDGGVSPLEEIRALGLDPLQDLDRVALGDDGVVLSGDFSRVRWDTLFGSDGGEPYGSSSQIRSLGALEDGGVTSALAIWGNQLVLIAPTRAAAMATVDRIEGRSPIGQLLSDDQAYGDMYGVVSGAALGQMLGPTDSPVTAQLQSAARSVELHLDATRDVGLVATVTGDNSAQLQDLGKTLGGSIALARARAVMSGDTVAAELLEYAQVTPGSEKLNLEMAVPFEVLQSMLAFCSRGAKGDAGR
jgi:hypothetical protein